MTWEVEASEDIEVEVTVEADVEGVVFELSCGRSTPPVDQRKSSVRGGIFTVTSLLLTRRQADYSQPEKH